jgi:hypothetical protein
MGQINEYKIFVGKSEERSTRRPRRRREDNIGMDLREILLEFVDWMHLTQNRDHWLRLVNTVMNLRVYKRRGFLH